ncbi:hypothetical protein C8A00DRAFT_31301 [Chaetomidium leptoderma]|uniref:Uncharacterized protein n=1 Tax=Chaetomidium leptoderma TaxID=669021 RepID=A0AAN6ZYU2_9PEZI|nr:hypothetical protein C8A00DRAFT_31301 [Chaetomidium leptoderma]
MPATPGYMSYRIVQSYYEDLTKSLDVSAVGRLWSTILNLYFTVAEDFGVEVQPRPNKMANDVNISHVHHASNKGEVLYLLETGHVEFEGQKGVWTDTVLQLAEYMAMQRKVTDQTEENAYGVVTVGRYSHFFIMEGGQDSLAGYPGTDDDYHFEFKKDEGAIIDILLQIKATVSRAV